ncbi:MAG: hypothetical protein ACTJHT_15770, partial [Sphingobacterium sp.]
GLRLMKINKNGKREELILQNPIVTEQAKDRMLITGVDQFKNVFKIEFKENEIDVSCQSTNKTFKWLLELNMPTERLDEHPFQLDNSPELIADFRKYTYQIPLKKGRINKGDGTDFVFQFIPSGNTVIIDTQIKHLQ